MNIYKYIEETAGFNGIFVISPSELLAEKSSELKVIISEVQ